MATVADAIAVEESKETREKTGLQATSVNNHGIAGLSKETPDLPTQNVRKSMPAANDTNSLTSTPETPALLPYSAFTKRQRWAIVIMASSGAFFSPISATTFLPALTDIASDLDVSINAINITVTVYMVFQGLSPSVWGAMADVLGRRPLYLITFAIYVCANIGLAVTEVYWLFLLLRCVQATGSASMIALSQGTVADIASPSERGGMVSIANLGAMIAPAIGPVIGSLLGQYLGWHSIFWFLTITGAIMWGLLFLFLPETLRSIVGDGSIEPKGINKPFYNVLTHKKYSEPTYGIVKPPKRGWKDIDWLAPVRMIFSEKDIALILLYGAILYSLTFAVIVTLASDFKETYGLTTLQDGLCYMAYGFGAVSSSFIARVLMDRDFALVAEKAAKIVHDDAERTIPRNRAEIRDLTYFPIEKARLRSAPVTSALLVGSAFVYGWCLEYRVHMAVPLVMSFLVGFSGFIVINCVSTLIVDCFPDKAASVTASNNLVRCCLGAACTGFISPLISAISPGPAFTLLSGFAGVFSVVVLIVERRYGMRWRQERAFRDKPQSSQS